MFRHMRRVPSGLGAWFEPNGTPRANQSVASVLLDVAGEMFVLSR